MRWESVLPVCQILTTESSILANPLLQSADRLAEAVSSVSPFLNALDRLERQLQDRQSQLQILEDLLDDRKIQSEIFIAGRPIEQGWIASRFGQRPDPFTGRMSFHAGLDFTTGRAGAEINTVASGVVTWSDLAPATD